MEQHQDLEITPWRASSREADHTVIAVLLRHSIEGIVSGALEPFFPIRHKATATDWLAALLTSLSIGLQELRVKSDLGVDFKWIRYFRKSSICKNHCVNRLQHPF